MTMIAALKLHGIPVLIGDFLITDILPGARHQYTPTRPLLSQSVPGPGERRVCGLRKKIHKIGNRLAVGFTGSLAPGETLMRCLYDRFSSHSPTWNELKEFLAGLEFAGKRETHLVGWICEKRPLCFQWRGTMPNELERMEAAFAGSGAEHFQNTILPVAHSGGSEEIKTAIDKAIYTGITKVGNVLFSELVGERTIENHYGYGAEMIFWDGAKFSYVENIAYSFWTIKIQPDNSAHISPAPVAALYKNYDSYSVMQVIHIGPKENPALGLESKNTFVQVITPIYDAMDDFDIRSMGRQAFESDLWYSGFVLENSKKSLATRFSIASENNANIHSLVGYRDGMISLNVKEIMGIIPQDYFN